MRHVPICKADVQSHTSGFWQISKSCDCMSNVGRIWVPYSKPGEPRRFPIVGIDRFGKNKSTHMASTQLPQRSNIPVAIRGPEPRAFIAIVAVRCREMPDPQR
jgi:hypothetical protein